MAFLPRPCATLLLGKERTGGASADLPSSSAVAYFPPSGSCSVRESVPCGNTFKHFRRSIPSWACSSLRFPRRRTGGISPPPLSRFTATRYDRSPCGFPPFRATAAPQRIWFRRQCRSLSRAAPSSRFPASISSPVRGNVVLAHRLAAFASGSRWRRRSLKPSSNHRGPCLSAG